MQVHHDDRLQVLELEARATANLGRYLLMVNGVKQPESTWLNDFEEIRLRKEIKAIIPTKGAREYLKCLKKGLVPDWVERSVDIKKIERAAS